MKSKATVGNKENDKLWPPEILAKNKISLQEILFRNVVLRTERSDKESDRDLEKSMHCRVYVLFAFCLE